MLLMSFYLPGQHKLTSGQNSLLNFSFITVVTPYSDPAYTLRPDTDLNSFARRVGKSRVNEGERKSKTFKGKINALMLTSLPYTRRRDSRHEFDGEPNSAAHRALWLFY